MKKISDQHSFFTLEDKELEAIDFLKRHEPQEGYFVGFSGGKDSIVTLKLCQMSGVKHQAFYSCTGIDEPTVVKFIKQNYPDVKWLMPKMSFWEGVIKKGPPLRKLRWCCDILKKYPAKEIPLKMRIMGIRAEESFIRAHRARINSFAKQTTFKPIFNWKEYDVWDFIEKYNLTYPDLYDNGGSRTGCVICPFIFGESEQKQKQLKIKKEKYKGMYEKFERCVKKWWESKKSYRYEQSFEEYMDLYYRGFPQNKLNIQNYHSHFYSIL